MTQELPLPCISLLTLPFNISCQSLACLTPLTQMAGCSHRSIFLTYFSMTHQSHQYTQTHHGPYYLWTLQTLLELFQSISSRPHTSPNSPFFSIVRHTSMKIPNYPRKGSFLFSTAAHIVYFCTACIVTCMLAPQIYLACKHIKLCTLVTAMTLQRLPITEAMSTFEIPQNEEAKLICQDPWVSIAVTLITILGIAVYVYRACSKMTFFKGYLYDNTCTIYLFLSHECYHVPVKLRELNGLLHTFAPSGQLKAQNLQLLKHTLWDTLHIKWLSTTLNMNGKRIDLTENVNIPLWDKIKVRSIMAHKSVKFNIMIKQGNTWYAPKIEMTSTRPQIQEEV